MKIKVFGLLLSSSLILAACGGSGEESANEDTTETEGGPLVENEASEDEDQATSTENGGTERDAATEENTPDESEDGGEETQQSGETTTGHPSQEGTQSNNNMGDNEGESTESDGSSNMTSSNNGNSNSETIALEDISMTADEAISAAEEEAEGDIHEISFEHEGEGWHYKVDLNNGSEESEVVVSQDTGEILDVRTEQEDDDDDDNQEDVVDYGSLNEAYDAIDEAIADLGGGEVSEWTLSMDDGVPEYNIDLVYENQMYEYKINAETLEILETEQDD